MVNISFQQTRMLMNKILTVSYSVKVTSVRCFCYHPKMEQKKNFMANGVDPDQTASEEQSDQCLQCLQCWWKNFFKHHLTLIVIHVPEF